MESNSRKRKGFLHPLRNPISNSREWRARKMQEISLMKPISNGDQWWELIREDDLPSLDQETDPDLLLLLLKYKKFNFVKWIRNALFLFLNGSVSKFNFASAAALSFAPSSS
ncbi:hypothetical protein GOBAR_AA11976 [Gossypium barbadense]|uniref:Uncharacterized protein n=1 Tax=Gossypium barbadense TaxID=3634 RepID=A0A2P5XZ93_GOSBA|nr:hypothetical protein GOBAR_AA11976 [Gossypium barbadense]